MDLGLDLDLLSAPPVDEAVEAPTGVSHSAAGLQQSDLPDAADPETPLAIEDLFGEFFEVDDQQPVDPVLVDTRSFLLRLFGTCVHEEDLDLEDEKLTNLAKEMADNKAAARFAAVEKCFGVAGAAALEDEHIEPFGCLLSSIPNIPNLGDYEELWLTDMPRIAPNRQTLHMEPRPFRPAECTPMQNTDRSLYTTQNVVRWAYHQGTNTFMSNARVVRWSDGTVTLHVGSDLFTLQQSRESSLTMLAGPAVVRKGNHGIPAMVSALTTNEHFVVEGATAASIEEAIIAENAQFRSVSTQHNLAYSSSALPNINWNKITTPHTPMEEYVMKEYNRRQKIIEQRRKEGRPMTLTEQMDMENEFLEKLRRLSAEELLEQQAEEQREAALRDSARQRQQQRRGRFERTVELEGGDIAQLQHHPNDDEEDNTNNNYGHGESEVVVLDGEGETGDYETMLETMRKRQREEEDREDDERRRRVRQREEEQVQRNEPLISALRDLLPHIPMGTSALGSVQGTLDFLSTGAFSSGVIQRELPLMMDEVAEECPEVDLSSLKAEFERLYPNV